MALKIVGCLSMSTMRRRCVTITAVCVDVHMSDNRQTLMTLKIVGCLSMSNIWRRWVTIKGVCVHVERREKFQLITPLSMSSKIQSIAQYLR